MGEFAAAGDIPTNDREQIKEILESSRWIRTKEDDGVFKVQLTEEFMQKYNRQLLAANSEEERAEIFQKAIDDGRDSVKRSDTRG